MKTELRKEYADIVERARVEIGVQKSSISEATGLLVALACQELADRPPKELTASEKYDLWLSCYGGHFSEDDFRCKNGTEVVDKIIAAFLAKQREPQVVKFRALRSRDDGSIVMVRADAAINLAGWEWLEPAQEFEVRI